jgi:TatD DNase family protein
MLFVDLHTHKIKSDAAVQIRNIFAQDLTEKAPDDLFSAGIHPWHLGNVNIQASLDALNKSCGLNNLLAVGECGLDKAIATDFALQKNVFLQQIELAGKHGKPLIIHSVRSFNELIQMKKDSQYPIPWILHGYLENSETTRQLSGQGFYFSVGETLLHNPKLQQTLHEIPQERLFFETDDRDISIQKIYFFAAQILKLDIEWLARSIASNFINLFGDDKLAGKGGTADWQRRP